MIHLITLLGKTAQSFYLEASQAAHLQTVIRGLNAGRSLIISTKFRTDLFYQAEVADYETILKLWAMHLGKDLSLLDENKKAEYSGDEIVMNQFFQAMNKLSGNWHQYRLYQKAVTQSFLTEPRNPLTLKLLGCDQHLCQLPQVKRKSLVEASLKLDTKEEQDTFAMAMRLVRNDLRKN